MDSFMVWNFRASRQCNTYWCT